MSRVVVVGSLNVDATSYVADFPAPGETVRALDSRTALGGKGANQAVAVQRAGAQALFVARIGDDANGAFARAELARFGVADDALASLAGAPTGAAQIAVAESGENTIIISAGANAAFDEAAVDAEASRFADADLVLTQGELPTATIDRIAALAVASGTRFVLNLAPPAPVTAETLAAADPLVLNEHEARAIGISPDADASSVDAWLAAAERAVGAVARSVVVTLGGSGAVAADADGSYAVAAPRVTAIDTTGAGDGFTGTLAAMLADGRPLEESTRLAVVAGALAVQRRGTADAYASLDEVLAAAGA
ncbi:ribokinase [Agromyces soli]